MPGDSQPHQRLGQRAIRRRQALQAAKVLDVLAPIRFGLALVVALRVLQHHRPGAVEMRVHRRRRHPPEQFRAGAGQAPLHHLRVQNPRQTVHQCRVKPAEHLARVAKRLESFGPTTGGDLGREHVQPAQNRFPRNRQVDLGDCPLQVVAVPGRRISLGQRPQRRRDSRREARRVQTVPIGLHLVQVSAVIRGQAAGEELPVGEERAAGDVFEGGRRLGVASGINCVQGGANGSCPAADLRQRGRGLARTQHGVVGCGSQQLGIGRHGQRAAPGGCAIQKPGRHQQLRQIALDPSVRHAQVQQVLQNVPALAAQAGLLQLSRPGQVGPLQQRPVLGRRLPAETDLGVLERLFETAPFQGPLSLMEEALRGRPFVLPFGRHGTSVFASCTPSLWVEATTWTIPSR